MRRSPSSLCLLALLVAAPLVAQESTWQVGLARVKITPEQPVHMAGYASRDRPFESVHDDLFAKALVLADEKGNRGVLVTTDLIGLTKEIADPIRRRIEEQTGIPAAAVLLSSSHTHTGPSLSLDPMPREGKALADTERTVAYTKGLQDKLVEVAADAAKKLSPARLSWGTGVVHFVMNRREFTTERGVILGVNPRGQADRSVPVLRIDGADGQPLAVVFGAASHNTTLGPRDYEISGDYAGHAQRLVEEQLPDVQAMFVLGCAGDANPYPRGTHAIAEQHGKELATEVLRIVHDKAKLAPVRGPLKVAVGEAALPLAEPPPKEELEKMAAGRGGTGPWMAQRMLERLARGEKLPTEYKSPLAVWQLGNDLTLVALSGEVVVDYVRLLEDDLGQGRLWIAAYCHDVYGYLPSRRVIAQGGYETRGLYSGGIGLFAPEAERALVNRVAELADQAGRAPAPSKETTMTQTPLHKAVTLYASFDKAVRADFALGEKQLATRFNHETEAGQFVFEPGIDEKVFRIAAGQGIHGGALAPADVLPRNGRIFFPAKGNIAYKPGGWSGAVSFWLNTDPNKLLKTRFCDPVQITHKGANNGGLWFDFNDAKPRDARMGAFPAFAPGEQGIKEDDPAAPLVIIKGVEFKEGEWHHVVLNWRNFDTGRADAAAELFIDGKSIGRIENRAIAMSWDLDKAGIYVAVNYLGLLDELAVFSRSLSEAEISELHERPGLLAPLGK
jgi:hypothetical protein